MSGRIFITGDKHRTFVPLFWLAEKEIQEKKRKGILGKTIVSVLTIFLLIFGNMIAKEADIPVNMLFSDNVVVYDLNDPNLTIEIIEK